MTGRSEELNEAAFTMGEAVADLLAWGGMEQAVVGDRVVAHARRLDPPTVPLTGYGDTVSSGDLVAEVFVEGSRRLDNGLMVLNLYDATTGNVNYICPDRYGYGIRWPQLAGAGWRREFHLVEAAPPDWRPHSNRTLVDDATVSTFDVRFARAGQPRPKSMVDLPTVAWAKTPSGVRHAVPAGTTLACCTVRVPAAPDTAPVFTAGAPGSCRRCGARVAAAAKAAAAAMPAATAQPAVLTCATRAVRHHLYAVCFRQQFFAPDRNPPRRGAALAGRLVAARVGHGGGRHGGRGRRDGPRRCSPPACRPQRPRGPGGTAAGLPARLAPHPHP